ncbi:TEN3 protein, partial [Polypterus senegalus]
MDVKERRPYCSLTKSRRDKERRYTNSSVDSEECRVPTQKSYSSSETLKAFDHDSSRLLYGSRVKEMVHREADEYSRQAGQNFTLRQLGICEPATRRGLAFCAEMGLPHRGYSVGAGSDVDTENEGIMSPEHAMRLWGRGVKSGRSSCLSSRSNSALTLTDTEHENKSDSENEQPANHQNQSTLQPVPSSHTQHPSQQHPSVTSLNRNSLTNRRNQSPAPPAALPAELQTTPESVQLQDSWVLGSNVPLESRHFLFKTGTGTTPLFSTATPGYTMATGAVYSPPTRPLPRNTLSRSAFKFKKSSKYCSWKCTALCAVGVSVLLAVLLSYFIAMHLFGLDWQLQETENYTFENGQVKSAATPTKSVTLLTSDNGKIGVFHQENNTIDSGEVDVGQRATQEVPPGVFWRSQISIDLPQFLKFNISLQKDALIGVYGRKGLRPSHTQYDFVELLDGRRLIAKEKRSLIESEVGKRYTRSVSLHEAGFIQYLETGIWHLAFYNDGKNSEQVSFNTIVIDGLVDCMDPDCCLQSSCQNQPYCRGSPDPNDIIGQSQQPPPQQAARSFYDRISFLVGPDNSHIIPGENPFNKSLASIIRGQVLTADGTPLIGVNVSFVHYPEHGYTITRQDGMFDLVANGGASLTLSFERAPFMTQYRTVWIPWNVFYVMDTLVMKKEENDIPSCDLSGFVRPSPIIVSSPLSTFFRSSPEESPIIPETQVLQEETAIPGSDLKLFYLSSRAAVSVGFEYESCLDLILWEKRTAVLQGYELDASNMGGWTLSNHHVLDVQNGILYKGNGENQFISLQPPVIGTIMGNGRRRSISCPSCNGQAEGNKLLAPVALACGIDGSLYVGDFNYIRRIFPSGNVTSVMELSNNPAHKYYLATDPVTGQLYVSDTNSRRIYRPKLVNGLKDLMQNAEVVAGTGEQCLPFDESRCGDGGKATDALLMGPKGIAVDKNGFIYFVDGTMIRKVDQNGIISTVLGSNDLTSARPLTCDTSMHISQVRLEWPTDLAINPMDNSIYVLDNNVVLQITENRQVRIAAGRPMHCQVPGIEYAMGKRAVQTTLESATAIAVSYSGVLYIAETDEKKINRIRQVTTDGEISLLAGIPSDCDCKNDANCDCYQTGDGYAKDAKLNIPSSLVVSPDGTLYIADQGNIRIRAVLKNKPLLNSMNFYEVASPADQELYIFDINGTHQYTMNLVTGDYMYNFSYSNDNDITAVTDSNGNTLRIRRDPNRMPVRIVSPDNQVIWLTIGTNGGLKSLSAPVEDLVWFTYHGSSGLLATKTTEIGWTTFFDYDSEGRLTNVTFPTGVVTNLHGDMDKAITVDVETSGREEDVSITTNLSSIDSFYTLVQDQLRNSYQVGYDNSLRIIYANGMDSHFQTEPHILAGPSSPIVARRNMTLPGENGQNLVEWRFRKEQTRGKIIVFGRKLRVNGRNLLSVDYDRTIQTEKIYDDHRKFLLKINYDASGHPTLWIPSSKLMSVNVTYSPTGQVTSIQRGTTSEKVEYDSQGRIVSRVFADGKMWSYTYLEKSMVLLLHSQRQYIFDYDLLDHLSAITMPSVARHTMQTIRSIGYYRNIYNPPESNASVIVDYSEDGQLMQVAHLGTGRRVLYKYRRQTKISEILYDSTRVSFTYDETAGVLKTVNLQSEGFICTIRYRQIGPLIDRQIFRFSEDGMVNARFDYSYDNSFRVTSMQGVINETPLPIDLYQFDDISGKVEQFGKFGVIYYDINQIISTAVMTYTKHFDFHGRIKEIQYEIFRSQMYWLTIQYDNMGRVTKREIKIGPFANTTRYGYEYDVDGQLQTVYLNDKIMWRYNYDLNGNLHLLNPSNSARLTPLRYDLRDRITRLGDVQYRLDEDGFLRQRGAEIFEYNSKGLLVRVYSKGNGWTVQYRYDGLGRRVSARTSLGQHLQFFYSDLNYPTRITHVYNHSSSEITSLYYDLQGHLFAMEISSGEEFYIACDNTGTPLAVFSSNGLMLKHVQYTAYGEIYFDSNPDFQLVIGFHGGLYDPLTKLIHFGERDYDILAGRWTIPDITIWKKMGKDPAPFNLYMFRNNNPVSRIHDIKEYVTDVNSWLVTFGFHLHNAIPGFPVPKFDLTEPSYELQKSQQWDDLPSISGVQQEVVRQAKAFLSFGKMPEIQISRHRSSREKSWLWFATVKSLIGKGVMLAVSQGRVVTNVLNIANEDCIKVAAVLNNAFYLENLHFIIEGKDTHYFIKTSSPEIDLGTLRLTSGRKTLENGINVTVSQSTTVVNGRTRRFADVEMQYGALALHIRYGMTLDEEKARILEQARQRALSSAWAREQQRVRDGEEGARLWTEGEKRQLLSAGKVQGYDGYYVLSVEQYPELADSANNIQFLRQSEIGKR